MDPIETTLTAPNAPWLIMLYMAGDNDLTEEMVLALQDLVAEGAASSIDRSRRSSIRAARGIDTQRYTFDAKRGAPRSRITATRRSLGGEINAGSPEALVDFVQWALKDTAPEMRYALVLSGHGGGTSDDFLLKDENSRDALSMKELQEALGRRLRSSRNRQAIPDGSSTSSASTPAS